MSIMIKVGKYKGKDVLFYPEKGNCKHILVTGENGMGKSVFSQRLMIELAKAGGKVVVFDINGVCEKDQIYHSIREEFLKLTKENDLYNEGIPLPLFERESFSSDKAKREKECVNSITGVLQRLFCLGVRQKAALKDAIKAVYEEKLYVKEGFSSIGHVLDVMDTKEALGALNRISPIVEHEIFYEGDYQIERGKINILRLSRFPTETQRYLTSFILTIIWESAVHNEFKDDGLFLFLDEAQNIGFGEKSPISNFLTEGRKLNVNLITSTQFLPSKADERHRLYQTSFIACFRPTEDDVLRMSKMINPNDAGKLCYLLRTLKRGEFVASGDFAISGSLEISGIPIRKPVRIINDLDSNTRMEELTKGSIKSCSKEVI